jgi:uncharacterized protein (TIRG00374 family)
MKSRHRTRIGRLAVGALAVLLLWLAFRNVSWSELAATLRSASLRYLAMFALLDVAIIVVVCARWSVLLRGYGHPIPMRALMRYRLTMYAVSYISPGPQLGGEVLQVYYPIQRHGVPTSVSLAVAAVDKALEYLGNFTFVMVGVTFALLRERLFGLGNLLAVSVASLFMLVPVVLLVAVARGRHPVSGFVEALYRAVPKRWRGRVAEGTPDGGVSKSERLRRTVRSSEDLTAWLFRNRPATLALAVALEGLAWVLIYAQFWVAMTAVHLDPTFGQVTAALMLVFASFVVPVPGAVGAMEAGLVFALTAFGYTPAQALSVAIIMRIRDLVNVTIGLLFGGASLWKRTPSMSSTVKQDDPSVLPEESAAATAPAS